MTPLAAELAALIRDEGPIPVGRYMALALGHPVHGYYRTRDPLGRSGDFTTAPEISQMFGELLGLWAAETWRLLGAPPRFDLVELGPGRGTLMADALRAVRRVPGFLAACHLHLVETSAVLRERQRAALAETGLVPVWHDDLAGLAGDDPLVLLANEFLDALPADQFVGAGGRWHERRVGLDADGKLAFGLSPTSAAPVSGPAADGAVLEVAPARMDAVRDIGRRLVRTGGAALLVDYGHVEPGFGDTLQAVRDHSFVDPLAEPGLADLTSHVDFAALADAAAETGSFVHGPVGQGEFLVSLGLRERAERLAAGRDATAATGLEAAVKRLAGSDPGQMGILFKVMGLSGPGLAALPGLPVGRTPPASPSPSPA